MHRCLISLGSNLGNPREQVEAASRLLADRFHGDHLTFSRLYRTPPIGGPTGQSDFVNGVLRLITNRSVFELWDIIREVENTLGRQRQQRWEARRIDLDILLYDDLRYWSATFKVPHPRFVTRRFLLAAACEVAADWIEPISQMTIAALNHHLQAAPPSVWILWTDRTRLRQFLELLAPATLYQPDWSRGKIAWDDSPRWVGWQSMPHNDTVSYVTNGAQIDTMSGIDNNGELTNKTIGSNRRGESKIATEAESQRDARSWVADAASAAIQNQPRMLCLAVDARDAHKAEWEEYARPWARLFRFAPDHSDETISFPGPRYLLNVSDIPFAVHEIQAALSAMNCFFEPLSDT